MHTEKRKGDFPSALYRLWKALGCPFPRIARFVRYRVWQKKWSFCRGGSALRNLHDLDISVIIVSHNYGCYLSEAMESVLHQTMQPAEIIVVDDASSDDTAEIAQSYAKEGVAYLRGEWRSVALARNAGASATRSSLLVFLDADDILPRTYLARCRSTFRDASVGIAYGDMREFGERNRVVHMPKFDREKLECQNYISSHAMMCRQAFDVVGGYCDARNGHEDWDLYLRIIALPWKAKKVRTFVWYRIHQKSMLKTLMAKNPSYAYTANLHRRQITIFTPFAGRHSLLPKFTQSLKNLETDPQRIRIHWFNTSTDADFDESLRTTISSLPFERLTYSRAPLPTIFGHSPESLIRNRVSDARDAQYFYEMALVYAYNSMLQSCDTDFVLTLEDDILPSPHTLKNMLETFTTNTVAVVAHYPCHLQGHSLVWEVTPFNLHRHVVSRRTGIEEVGGSGFGCSLFRVSALKKQPIRTEVRSIPPQWYDYIAFDQLRQHGRILCNWDINVEHVMTERYKN